MKPQEAIEELKYSIEPNQGFMECRTGIISGEAIKTAIEALEKQIPKKPELYDGNYFCTKCDALLCIFTDSYCSGCGQALDWSDNDE